jgi:hypothetical protein
MPENMDLIQNGTLRAQERWDVSLHLATFRRKIRSFRKRVRAADRPVALRRENAL